MDSPKNCEPNITNTIFIENFPHEIRKILDLYVRFVAEKQHLYTTLQQDSLIPPKVHLFSVDKRRFLIGLVCIATTKCEYTFHIKTSKHFFTKPEFIRTFEWNVTYFPSTLHVSIVWIPYTHKFLRLNVLLGKKLLKISTFKDKQEKIFITKLPRATNKKLCFKEKIMLFLSNLPWIKRKYQKCWLFIDRDIYADDNAEHLYRWVKENKKDKNLVFALSKTSRDWSRLKEEGFNLIDNRSLSYFFAYINAEWLISSNITGYIVKPNWKEKYASSVNHKLCFLQHGVTKDYQYTLNRHWVDMLLTTSPREHHTFTADEQYPYIYSEREAQMTGFPRHDALLRKASKIDTPSTILIMPTWRQNIVGNMIMGGSVLTYNPRFRESAFYEHWQKLFDSQVLKDFSQKNSLTIKIIPHPYLQRQIDDFVFPEYIKLVDTPGSIQETLIETALLVTDYSSIAFDIAMLRRNIIYYQFDKDSFFSEDHSYSSGYFNYNTDGFGPIAESLDTFEKALKDVTLNNMSKPFQERVDCFFAYHDMNNCQRIFLKLQKNTEKQDKR